MREGNEIAVSRWMSSWAWCTGKCPEQTKSQGGATWGQSLGPRGRPVPEWRALEQVVPWAYPLLAM